MTLIFNIVHFTCNDRKAKFNGSRPIVAVGFSAMPTQCSRVGCSFQMLTAQIKIPNHPNLRVYL